MIILVVNITVLAVMAFFVKRFFSCTEVIEKSWTTPAPTEPKARESELKERAQREMTRLDAVFACLACVLVTLTASLGFENLWPADWLRYIAVTLGAGGMVALMAREIAHKTRSFRSSINRW